MLLVAVNEAHCKNSQISRILINFPGKMIIFKELQVHLKWNLKFKHFSRTCTSPTSTQYTAVCSTLCQGWRQEFSDGGLTLLTRGLKYGFQGTKNAKNLRKNRCSLSDGGLACSDGGGITPSSPPLAPPLHCVALQ